MRSAVPPKALKSSPEKTSTGTVESAAERGLELRVPVVITSSRSPLIETTLPALKRIAVSGSFRP